MRKAKNPQIRQSASRRDFLKVSALASAAAYVTGCAAAESRLVPPTRKIRIGVIGGGGKGESDMKAVAHEDIVAICDVDWKNAEAAFKHRPYARRYYDWREMLDQEELDAVTISTPDHSHAPPALAAMEKGLHVYCQKPLTHTVEEARLMAESAARNGVVTQMGNQGTGMDKFREAVEVIRAGAIGKVHRVHVWTDRPIWAQGVERPPEIDPIPAHLRWDLFLGAAPYRPYNGKYCPFSWRGWWDYGTGALGDMACHIMNLPYLALSLGAPESVIPEKVVGLTSESAPKGSVVRYRFPARSGWPECELMWYDGESRPPEGLLPEGVKLSSGGSILEGDDGVLYSPDDYGRVYHLFPEEKFAVYRPPAPNLPRVAIPADLKDQRGDGDKIHLEWLDAIRNGGITSSGFHHAGPFTETILLGNVAVRLGREVKWDASRLRAIDAPEADVLIAKDYARGFHLPRRFA